MFLILWYHSNSRAGFFKNAVSSDFMSSIALLKIIIAFNRYSISLKSLKWCNTALNKHWRNIDITFAGDWYCSYVGLGIWTHLHVKLVCVLADTQIMLLVKTTCAFPDSSAQWPMKQILKHLHNTSDVKEYMKSLVEISPFLKMFKNHLF